MSALEKRLGGFVPSREPIETRARVPEPAGPLGRNWAKYVTEKQAHYAAKKHEREQLRHRHGRQWRAMTEQHRAERTEALGGDWRGRGDALNAMRSVLAAKQARDKAAIKEHQERERRVSRDRLPANEPAKSDFVAIVEANACIPAATADALGVSRKHVYALMKRNGIRTVEQIPDGEILASVEACSGNRKSAALRLRVSHYALSARLDALSKTTPRGASR